MRSHIRMHADNKLFDLPQGKALVLDRVSRGTCPLAMGKSCPGTVFGAVVAVTAAGRNEIDLSRRTTKGRVLLTPWAVTS